MGVQPRSTCHRAPLALPAGSPATTFMISTALSHVIPTFCRLLFHVVVRDYSMSSFRCRLLPDRNHSSHYGKLSQHVQSRSPTRSGESTVLYCLSCCLTYRPFAHPCEGNVMSVSRHTTLAQSKSAFVNSRTQNLTLRIPTESLVMFSSSPSQVL